jgi:hypothetical protein
METEVIVPDGTQTATDVELAKLKAENEILESITEKLNSSEIKKKH